MGWKTAPATLALHASPGALTTGWGVGPLGPKSSQGPPPPPREEKQPQVEFGSNQIISGSRAPSGPQELDAQHGWLRGRREKTHTKCPQGVRSGGASVCAHKEVVDTHLGSILRGPPEAMGEGRPCALHSDLAEVP